MIKEFDQSADAVIHCIGKNYSTCLDLSAFSGKSKRNNLRREFLKSIFSKRVEPENNIKFEPTNLPYNDNYFDLIICNDITKINLNRNLTSKNKLMNFFREINRVLKNEGCFCFEQKNDQAIQILEQIGFKTKKYWVNSSLEYPYFSARLDQKTAKKWYMNNFEIFFKKSELSIKKKIALKFLKADSNLNFLSKSKIFKNLILCCYKNEIPETIEDIILKNVKPLTEFLVVSRPKKINYICIDSNCNAKKIIQFNKKEKRYLFPSIIKNQSYPPKKENNDTKIWWIEDWHKGRFLDLSNVNEVLAAIHWLIKFQNENTHEIMNDVDIENEIKIVEKIILEPGLSKYQKWKDDYKLYFKKNKIKKTAIHGDFWFTNILVDTDTLSIKPIDWELREEKGNPFHDFGMFFLRWLIDAHSNPVDSFKTKLESRKFQEIRSKVEKDMEDFFGFKINLFTIIRYALIRKYATTENLKVRTNYLKMLKIFEKY